MPFVMAWLWIACRVLRWFVDGRQNREQGTGLSTCKAAIRIAAFCMALWQLAGVISIEASTLYMCARTLPLTAAPEQHQHTNTHTRAEAGCKIVIRLWRTPGEKTDQLRTAPNWIIERWWSNPVVYTCTPHTPVCSFVHFAQTFIIRGNCYYAKNTAPFVGTFLQDKFFFFTIYGHFQIKTLNQQKCHDCEYIEFYICIRIGTSLKIKSFKYPNKYSWFFFFINIVWEIFLKKIELTKEDKQHE